MVTAGSFRAGGLFIFVKEMINIAIKLLTSVTYTATGEQTTFAIPFDYLRPAFVYVSVDDEKVASGFEVIDRSVVFTYPPAEDAKVKVYRTTSTKPLVSWSDASILKARDMSVSQIQELHILEEAQDKMNNLLSRCETVLTESKENLAETKTLTKLVEKLQTAITENVEEIKAIIPIIEQGYFLNVGLSIDAEGYVVQETEGE